MSGTQHNGTQDAPLQGGMLWVAAIVLATANFIAVLDMTIANVSVPNVAGSLGISSSQGTWVINSYSVVAPILGPILGGWLCDSYSWPVIFFINVPIALFCAPIALRMLKRYETALLR